MAIDINIPSQVKTFANLAGFPVTGAVKTIYIAEDTNKTYRWTGSVYVEISASGAGGSFVPYTGATANVDLGTHTLSAKNLIVNHSSGSGDAATITKGGSGEALKVIKTSGSGNAMSVTGGNVEFGNGNVLIGTTTDAGFRLDVNGSSRFTGNTTIGTTTTTNTQLLVSSSTRADIILRSSGATNDTLTLYTLGGTYGSNYAQIGVNDGVNAASQGGAIYLDSRTGITAPIRLVVKATGTTAMSTAMSVFNTTNIGIGTITDISSAILNVASTTKGFLPPRMTTTQVNAIATPAEGLVVYNTTISHLCVYQAGSWVKINHSPM